MWVSRGQAQNSADAGALAGAISLAFDSSTDQDGARAKAIALARRNRVWTEAPDITNADVTFPPCPPGAPGLPDTCIKVDVFRNQRAGGSPLPVFFSRLVGITNQGVRATATAQIITGDTTDCLKPWAILDRWDEYNTATNGAEAEYPNPDPDFLPSSTFDRYSTGQGSSPPQENDLYVRPTPGPTGSPGTGFRLPQDEGRQFGIKVDSNTSSTVSPGWFRAIRLPRLRRSERRQRLSGQHHVLRRPAVELCRAGTVCPTNIGNDDLAYWAERGCYATEPGNKVGPTRQGIEDAHRSRSWRLLGSNGGITGSAFSPGDLEPTRRSYWRHRHRRLPVAGPQRGQRCPSNGQHLRVLHRRHGRCERDDGPADAQSEW